MKISIINYNGGSPKSNDELWAYLISTYKSATDKIQQNKKKAEEIDTISNNKTEPIDKLPKKKKEWLEKPPIDYNAAWSIPTVSRYKNISKKNLPK